jgi:hypothetical protein
MSYLQLSTIGLGNLNQYPMAKVYMVLGAWIVALAFTICATVEFDTSLTTAQAAVPATIEAKSKKQQRCNLYAALTLFALVFTFYFALQLL